MATTYQIKLYEYDELSDTAKETAFHKWWNSDITSCLMDYEYDELSAALASFCKLAPFAYPRDHYGSLFFAPVNVWEASGKIDRMPVSLSTADCFDEDLATAWNEHADDLKQLSDALNDVSDYFGNVTDNETAYLALSDAQDKLADALSETVNAALKDVARAYNKDASNVEDYYIDIEQMRELFKDCYARETRYTVDGFAFDPDKYGMIQSV